MRSHSWTLLTAVVVTAAGCAEGESGDNGDGAGGSGGDVTTTSTVSSNGANSSGQGGEGEGGAPTLTDLQSICEAGCANVAELSNELGCAPTIDCVADCVGYGESLTVCRSDYEQLMACAVGAMSTQTCHCSPPDGNILSCDLCPAQLDAFQTCIAFKQ